MYENVTIKKFMKSWFNEDYSELSKEDFDTCYSEYIDAAGLFATEEFDIIANINYLNNRVNTVQMFVSLQKQYLEQFDEPYINALSFLRKFGYKLEWKGNNEEFINKLDKVLLMDSKYQVQLDTKMKQLFEYRKKKQGGEETTIKQTRESFIRMLNGLGKIGYKIDKNETTVEELALMLKQQSEESEALKFKYG